MSSNNPPLANKKKELTDDQIQNVAMRLLMSCHGGVHIHGAKTKIAKDLGISESVVTRVWKKTQKAAVDPTDLTTVEMSKIKSARERNDLGFFAALQAHYYRIPKRNFDDMVAAVEKAYQEYDPVKLNRNFVTLQTVLNECLKLEGGNFYKIPHLNKAKLEREGRLPLCIDVCEEVVQAWLTE